MLKGRSAYGNKKVWPPLGSDIRVAGLARRNVGDLPEFCAL
jgi:hypothetical protein